MNDSTKMYLIFVWWVFCGFVLGFIAGIQWILK